MTVAEDVFWGPAKTEAFIRSNEPTTEWLDDVWAQGGIALDKDNRRLTYYYSEWPDDEDIRRVYESLLEETWRGSAWSVSRASTWQALSAAVDVGADAVTATPTGPGVITFDQLGKNRDRSFCCAVLSVKTDETWQDHAIDFLLPGFLMNGPALLERLSAVAGSIPAGGSRKFMKLWAIRHYAESPFRFLHRFYRGENSRSRNQMCRMTGALLNISCRILV